VDAVAPTHGVGGSEETGVLDALRGYVQLATGLTEVTLAKAREAAAALLSQGLNLEQVPDVPGKDTAVDAAKVAATQVQGLADELLEQSKANRELLTGMVRTEVDRAAGRLGFVREEELAAVRRHVARLETQLAEIRAQLAGAGVPAPVAEPSRPPVKKKVPARQPSAKTPDSSSAPADAGASPASDAGAAAATAADDEATSPQTASDAGTQA
jgi:polyhydroxyalkanoate synthesis regulator phasin